MQAEALLDVTRGRKHRGGPEARGPGISPLQITGSPDCHRAAGFTISSAMGAKVRPNTLSGTFRQSLRWVQVWGFPMLARHRDFSDVLERTIKGGVRIDTDADAPSKTSEDSAVWLRIGIAGINVLKVEAGMSRHPLIEDD